MIRIRPATETDLDAIEAINNGVQAHPWSYEALLSELKLAVSFSSVAEENGRVLGYCLARKQGDSIELMIIGVARQAQRRGVGKTLIKHLFQSLPGGMEIFLEVAGNNSAAIAFYKQNGFQTYLVRKAYYRDGTDALCMKTKVANP
jgi:[ribosomal protein S18]-alanine N-acetyltransferase